MRRVRTRHLVTLLAGALTMAMAASPVLAESTATQSFTLRPGWNAVFLEVQPEPRDPASVFAGIPVASVWTWMERHTTMRYLQNPGEPLWDKSGWNGYRFLEAEVYLSNLHAILANRAYLVKLDGPDPVDWTVTGRPSTAPRTWTPDSFNLVGFPVDPAAPPTFAQFLAPSAAHAGQAVFRLSDGGMWEFVDNPSTTAIRRGEAYWVWCEGVSAYQGPLQAELPGDGLQYGAGLTELAVRITNHAASDREVTLRQQSPAFPEALVVRELDAGTRNYTWPPLPQSFDLAAGGRKSVTLAVRRESYTGTSLGAILEITDGAGTLLMVPVSADKTE